MGELVVEGALIKCAFGMVPMPLNVIPPTQVLADGLPVATIAHVIPMVNILPFGLCMSPANPEVIAETAAALGVPTPAPCIPITVDPWVPGAPTILVDGVPALTQESFCMCAWAGLIEILEPGQITVLATE
jgi:hypothetical protein